MLLLLSPAKKLDFDTPLPVGAAFAPSLPAFAAQAAELAALLRALAVQDMAALMRISDALAALNVARFAAFDAPDAPRRQAVLAFAGDVYKGMDVRSLDGRALRWMQEHVCVLSGLYGALRPMDAVQPHRLEMGTRLPNARGASLYDFWRERVGAYLSARLAEQGGEALLLNLASQEYARVADAALLPGVRVVDCVFEQRTRNGRYATVAIHAKRARGMMARHAAQRAARCPDDLLGFGREGYAFEPAASSAQRLVFRRSQTSMP